MLKRQRRFSKMSVSIPITTVQLGYADFKSVTVAPLVNSQLFRYLRELLQFEKVQDVINIKWYMHHKC